MKKLVSIILAVLLVCLSLFGCSLADNETNKSVELTIFAASSLSETLTQLGDIYCQTHPDTTVVFNFDSSGTLKTQIEEGAVCDIFISASVAPMDSLNCFLDNSKVDLLENKVSLVVPNGNPKKIDGFDDLITHLNKNDIFIAIGNADVPVGEYTTKIFEYYDLSIEELNDNEILTYGSNAKEVTTHISEGMVDCGIVYQTDAYSANLEVVDTATVEMCGQVIYPAAILEGSHSIDQAKKFLEFLQSKEASLVFKEVGFTPLF